jgi:hypothetical protein
MPSIAAVCVADTYWWGKLCTATPSMSLGVTPASAIAATEAWAVSASSESPVLRPTVE